MNIDNLYVLPMPNAQITIRASAQRFHDKVICLLAVSSFQVFAHQGHVWLCSIKVICELLGVVPYSYAGWGLSTLSNRLYCIIIPEIGVFRPYIVLFDPKMITISKDGSRS